MSVIRIFTFMSFLALGLIVGMCGLAEAQTLSGTVYEGEVGNETKPLSGVTVKLYCSSNAYELGELKASTATNFYGWYAFQVPPGYQFYNIVEEDLPGYNSVGATSVSGTVKNYNWIQYQQSLDGKTLSGNKFWDRPKPANSPPNANAGPDQTVECACNTPQGTNVVLDGSGSTDPDGDPLSYTWTGPFLGSPASGSKPKVTLSGECLGPHIIMLVVNDGQVDSQPDTMTINVVDTRAPVVDAGPDINVGQQSSSGTTVILNGSALDNCDPQLDYQWIENGVILGQSATLTHDFGLGAHALTLKAVDDSGNVGTDKVTVSIVPLENMPDLIITDIWSENETIYYQIMNVGGSVAPQGHYTALFVDGEYKENGLVSQDLQPGQRLKGRFHWSWQCTGLEDNILIKADYEGSLAESNEKNNQRQESWKCDTIPPAILLGPVVRSVSQSTAVIYWDTSEDSNSVVKYDKVSGRYGFEKEDSALSKRHTITLTGLELSTVYHFVVQSSDLSGNTATSKDCTFETRCSVDNSDPSVRILDPGQCAGRAKITAFADDNVGVRKVEFYLDEDIIFTDFTSPYEHYLDTTKHVNGKHTLGAKAYDLSGRTALAARTIDIFNPPPDSNSPSIEIVNPGQGATVSGIVDIKVQATDPPSQGQTPPVLQPVNRVEFYIDGVYRATGYPVVYMTTYSWNTQTTAVGNRTITATAYDDAGNSASDSITVNVEGRPPPEPVIVVTRGPVERDGTAFTVCLDVENTGDAAASNIEILDYVRGFQTFRYGPPVVTYDHVTRESEVHLTVFDLAAHSSIRLGYYIVPILFEDDTSYAIGTHTDLSYRGPAGGTYGENLSIPVTQVKVNPGDYRNVAHATECAIAQADYLSVTDPSRLFGYFNSGEVDILLYHMAHLAWLKRGVLGYLDTYDTSTLNNLIEPGGNWATKLHPNFSTTCGGTLLIVGETEIVPSWDVPGYNQNFAGGTVDVVHLTDNPYADTVGSDDCPELIVGRIIGNTPASLIMPIQASIGVHQGLEGFGFDRSDALLVSGPTKAGDGGGFKINVDEIADMLDDELTVTKLHQTDYYLLTSFPLDYEEYDGLAVGDISGDNKDEIIIADRSLDKIFVYDAGVGQVTFFDRDFDTGDHLAVGDVGWDERDEIVIGDKSEKKIYIYTPLWDGTAWVEYQLGRDFQSFDGLAVGDVMGDGKEEILIARTDDDCIDIYDKDGNHLGGFPCDFEYGDGFAVGDVMGDGKEEILIADKSQGEIYIYNATGSLLTPAFSCDFGGDDGFAVGDQKILWATGDDQLVRAYNTAGEKVWSFWCRFSSYDGFVVGDVIGDSGPEIIVASAHNSEVYIQDRHSRYRVPSVFKTQAPNKDIIYFSGHGNQNSWGVAPYTDDFADLPISFGSSNPLVFAAACLTGYYEGGDDYRIAEAFFGGGAAVYIGSTEVSGICKNLSYGKKFFADWDASESIGEAFTRMERELVSSGSTGDSFWVAEYNIYGDPKFKVVTAGAADTSAGKASLEPLSSIDVVVPDYEVITHDVVDYIEIHGGGLLLVEDKPQVPYWSTSVEYPQGYKVQDVVLVDRSGLMEATGLNLPVVTREEASSKGTELFPGEGTGWYPEESYSWRTLENPDGSSTLVIVMYPFYYNTLTTDVKFCKNFSFDITYTVSAVAISSLATDKDEYEQSDTVIVDVELNNSGPAQDVIVNAVVKRYGSAEIVDGLLLESLKELTGPACFSPEWGSNESEPGYYCVEVTLKNTAGNVLDRKSEMFRMGISSGEITYFTAAPEYVQVGNDVTINMTFENTGTVNITGTAHIKIVNSSGVVIDEFEHAIADLLSMESVSFSDIWSVSEAGPCKIMGYVSYDSKSTAPAIVEVNKECFPNGYSTYNDWVTLGKPACWCTPYQCDGDADGKDSGGVNKFRVFTGDLSMIVANWKKKAGDPTLDPCADIDHKNSGGINKYRVFTGDLNVLVTNWKKKDADLLGNCPRAE